ncbi:MAG: hypothetical protein WBO73_17470 [Gammaproteobacteria bacterium]
MINNEVMLHALNALSHHHAGEVRREKVFYDQVKSDFLQQSARYLRESYTGTQAVAHSFNR